MLFTALIIIVIIVVQRWLLFSFKYLLFCFFLVLALNGGALLGVVGVEGRGGADVDDSDVFFLSFSGHSVSLLLLPKLLLLLLLLLLLVSTLVGGVVVVKVDSTTMAFLW